MQTFSPDKDKSIQESLGKRPSEIPMTQNVVMQDLNDDSDGIAIGKPVENQQQ